ncbi:Cyanovirin-N [Penicillium sp. IBT 16267x]|nr:Cyanovirin-N [Penicillium sp. IBT 16267x]
MSFHESATNIELEDGHILKARLRDGEGEEREAEMDLNQIIGNDNGHFCWDGENFKESATGIELSIEGPGIPVLRANLFDVEGEEIEANINLAERISNENGELVFV